MNAYPPVNFTSVKGGKNVLSDGRFKSLNIHGDQHDYFQLH